MMPFIDMYDNTARIVGLRYREWDEAGETTDTAEESIQVSAKPPVSVQSLAAWLTSHVHATPVTTHVPQARRRHA